MDPTILITSFVTLFVVIDPIGLTPMFVALTSGMTFAQRKEYLANRPVDPDIIGHKTALTYLLARASERHDVMLDAWRLSGSVVSSLILNSSRYMKADDPFRHAVPRCVFCFVTITSCWTWPP